MDRLHARYPFLQSAREAVEAADVDLVELIETDAPAVERGYERVKLGLSDGTIGEPRRSTRTELLSYPIARVLVSLLDDPMVTDTYARAEAATAQARLEADLTTETELQSTASRRLSVDQLLREFGLADAVTVTETETRIAVTQYLTLSRNLEGEQWRLVNRSLTAGEIPLERPELLALLEEAVADRVSDGLPLSVPEPIADRLATRRQQLESLVETPEVDLAFETVDPNAFPPCMTALLAQARRGETLDPPGQFALVGFLAGTELDADAVCDLAGGGLDRETVAYQLAHLRGQDGVEYVPPSCQVMVEYGLCVNRDELCEQIPHPAEYYHQALAKQE